jgi:hypothetical protein
MAAMALSGGGLAAPVLTATPAEAPIQTPVVLTGSGFTPGAPMTLEWQTMVGNRVSGSGFAEVSWPLAAVTADAGGNVNFEFTTPADLGGPPHHLNLMDGDTLIASTQFTISRTAKITPSSGPLGTTIELHMTGGGWTQYDNIVTVTYDNAYIGYMCSFNTQGNMTTWFPASGGLGLHTVDVWPALYTGPSDGAMPWKLPHLSTGDQPWQPPMFHFEFTVTDMNGTVPAQAASPPPAAGEGPGPALLALAAAVGLGAAAIEWPIRRSTRRARAPAVAAAALVVLAVLAAAGTPAAAASAAPEGPPIMFMASGSVPALALSAGTATPGEPITVAGSGMPVSAAISLEWSTANVVTKADGEKFLGWNVTQATWSLGTVQTDAAGAFGLTIPTPYDYSGIHQISARSSGSLLASSGLVVVPRFEIAGPTHVKAGEKVTVRGYGLGYEKYSASWNVAYDNRLTGWVSGIEAHGNVTFFLYAVGSPGQHFIDVGEGAVGFPYLNLWESPFQNRPPAHLSFVIDGDGAARVAPAASSDSGLPSWAVPLVGGVAVGALAVQAVRFVRVSRAAARAEAAKP